MKKCIASLLVSLPVFLLAQGVDSIAMRQVDSLILVSRDFTAKMDYDKALEVNASAERIALEIFGSESAAYGSFCFNQGRILYFKGDHAGAEKWYLEAKAIREMVPGEEHYDYAGILHNLATLYLDMGDFEKAEPLYVAVKIIREKKQGKDHPLYVSCLNNLALLYKEMGYLEKAEPLHLEAIDIRARTIGREHPNYALSLNNLAILYREMGKFEKAEPLYLESLDIRGTFFGREHPDYASSLNNLAIFYMSLGNYHKAESLYLEAKSIFEATIGREHPNYASSLSNLALLYMYMGNYGQAEPLWIETIGIRSKTLGREHPEYASGLYNLANLYSQKGDFERAMSCYLESMAIRQRVLGVEHYDYAQILFAMGDLYAQMDDFGKAEALYLEAEDIREKSLGKDHPDYVQSLDHLADLYERQSRSLEAEPLLEESLTLSQARMVNATTFLSEQELAQYAGNFLRRGDKLGSYLIGRLTDNLQLGKLPSLAYDHALFYKGFLLTAATRWNAPGLESPESLETYLRLKGYRRRLAVEYTLPVAERKGIADLEEKANIAEKELARMVTGYVEAIRQANFQEVKSTLAPDAMALEFVHFRVNFPTVTDSVMYAAVLLRPGAGDPIFIPLFEERELHHLLDDHKERRADYVNELYARVDRGTVKLGGEKKSLHDLIWAKIEAAGLEGIKTVYYSPSGVLHRLNLGAIAVDEETILSDKYNLVAMNSTRQLAIPTTVTTKANDALLVGGVNFEMDSVQTSLKEEPLMFIRSSAESWTESGTRGGSWSYLRWTEKEVERIVTSLTTAGFDAVQITGADATEEAIKSIGTRGPSPRILHIATHGFFFPDPEIDPSSRRGLGEGEPVFKSSDNPMIRSGLILAGGNYAWQHGRPVSPDREDGILTAYEISQMNLANTELVVLSACETGLGDIQGNEGVYGLQRAFKIAGAKYLIMSLWQVPDRETMEFMTAFYRNWLEEKRTIPEAFRKTQRELRDRFINPYSWAGFVLVE